MIFTLKPPCSYRNFPTNSHVRRSSPMFSPFEAMIAAYQRVGPTNSLFYHLPLVPFVLGLLIHCSPFFIICWCVFLKKLCSCNLYNVVKTIIYHSQIYPINGLYKPSTMGWFITVLNHIKHVYVCSSNCFRGGSCLMLSWC